MTPSPRSEISRRHSSGQQSHVIISDSPKEEIHTVSKDIINKVSSLAYAGTLAHGIIDRLRKLPGLVNTGKDIDVSESSPRKSKTRDGEEGEDNLNGTTEHRHQSGHSSKLKRMANGSARMSSDKPEIAPNRRPDRGSKRPRTSSVGETVPAWKGQRCGSAGSNGFVLPEMDRKDKIRSETDAAMPAAVASGVIKSPNPAPRSAHGAMAATKALFNSKNLSKEPSLIITPAEHEDSFIEGSLLSRSSSPVESRSTKRKDRLRSRQVALVEPRIPIPLYGSSDGDSSSLKTFTSRARKDMRIGPASASPCGQNPTPKRPSKARLRELTPSPTNQPVPTSQEYKVLLGSLSNRICRPYLSREEKRIVRKKLTSVDWVKDQQKSRDGQFIHVDFSDLEAFALLPSVIAVRSLGIPVECPIHGGEETIPCFRQRFLECIEGVGNDAISRIVGHARRVDAKREKSMLRQRDADIAAFLRDASRGIFPDRPKWTRVGQRPSTHVIGQPDLSLSHRLMLREAGAGYTRFGWRSEKLWLRDSKLRTFDSMKPWKVWPTGGSSDVVSVAWDRSGNLFAAGCAAFTDAHNMQYNRPNNLLLGSVSESIIKELPYHRLPRVRPESGPNSTDEMMNTLDPWLYYTMTSVQFSPNGQRLYSASYDQTVKIWETGSTTAAGPSSSSSFCRLLGSLPHGCAVDILATSIYHPELLATGSQDDTAPIRLFRIAADDDESLNYDNACTKSFYSARAQSSPSSELFPSCLQWGTPQNLLLAGYASNIPEEAGRRSRDGDLCLYDVVKEKTIKMTPSAQSVFDCVWHHSLPMFAVGCVADGRANRGIASYVRTYERSESALHELECPALDMNEVTWW